MKRFIASVLIVLAVFSVFGGMTASAADSSADVAKVSALLKESLEDADSEIEIASYNITVNKLKSILNKVLEDNPQIYYLKQYSCKGKGSSSTVSSVAFTYKISASQVKSQAAQIANSVKDIKSVIVSGMTDVEKALAVHDYIILHAKYTSSGSYVSTVYGALVEGKALCVGYSSAYQYVMDQILGIDCIKVHQTDKVSVPHCWNAVKIGGKYYNVDLTWDDPLYNNDADSYGHVSHKYFLLSDSRISTLQKTEGDAINWDKSVYKCTSTTYDSYFWKSLNCAIPYYNGLWYYVTASGLYSVNPDSPKKSVKLVTLSDKWSVWSDKSYYYDTCFCSIGIYNGYVYYSTPSSVKAYSISAKTNGEVAKVSESSGYVFGFVVDAKDAKLNYNYAKTPDASQKIVTVTLGKVVVSKGNETEDKKEENNEEVKVDYKGSTSLASMVSGSGIKWKSSDESIATVDASGNVTTGKRGNATIYATNSSGKVLKEFDVEVAYTPSQWILVIFAFGWIWM